MKKILLLLVLSLAPALQASSISLVFSQNTFFVGDTFTAIVRLSSPFDAPYTGDELFGFGFDATLTNNNPVVLTANTPSDTADFSLFFTANPNFIGGSSLLLPGPLASVDLAILNFTATAAGTANLLLNFVGDVNFYGIQYFTNTTPDQSTAFNLNTSITVADAVPEPGTVLLISAGLIGLAALRKRK
jgi:hypothetical protein